MNQKIMQLPPESHSPEPSPLFTGLFTTAGPRDINHLTEPSDLSYRSHFTDGETEAPEMSADCSLSLIR